MKLDSIGAHHRDLTVFQIDHFAGPVQNGDDIRGHHVLTVTDTHNQRWALSEGDDGLGLPLTHRNNRILTDESGHHLENPFTQRPGFSAEQLGDEFGVGVRGQFDPVLEKFPPQRGVVLQDSVVDHRDRSRRIHLGVGVGLGRGAVGRPAGMADSGGSMERAVVGQLFEIPELALGAKDLNAVSAWHGHPGGIITAVFEPPQAIEDDRHHLVGADIADDSTHTSPPRGFPRSMRPILDHHYGEKMAESEQFDPVDHPVDQLRAARLLSRAAMSSSKASENEATPSV